VSLLSEIGIYAQDSDDTLPLTDVFERIYQKYGASVPVTNKSSESELTGFLADVMPEYDRDRVYLSDIKKLATWYGIVSQHVPYAEASADEPAPGEPLSTGGVIGETDEEPTAAGNPEATK
jgi:hypothetical protein